MIGIYKITNPKGKIYIGQSIDLKQRENQYKSLRCKWQPKILNSIKKYGWDKHIFEIITECNIEELNSLERYYQELYNVLGKKGMNCELVNDGVQKRMLSLETRKKISDSVRKLPKPSFEIREKIRLARIGKAHSESTKLKISKIHLGRKLSEERKKEISNCNIQKICVINTDYGIFYDSMKEAADSLNMEYNYLGNRISRDRKNNTQIIRVD